MRSLFGKCRGLGYHAEESELDDHRDFDGAVVLLGSYGDDAR